MGPVHIFLLFPSRVRLFGVKEEQKEQWNRMDTSHEGFAPVQSAESSTYQTLRSRFFQKSQTEKENTISYGREAGGGREQEEEQMEKRRKEEKVVQFIHV